MDKHMMMTHGPVALLILSGLVAGPAVALTATAEATCLFVEAAVDSEEVCCPFPECQDDPPNTTECEAPPEDRIAVDGFWHAPVPFPGAGLMLRKYECEGGVGAWNLIGRAFYSDGSGNWQCSRVIDSASGTVTSGDGVGTQFVVFQGSTVGDSGACDAFPEYAPFNNIYFSAAAGPDIGGFTDEMVYVGLCAILCG